MADTLPKIYCWINAGKGTDWVHSIAMAEDGTVLTQHASSNDSFARGDSGFDERTPMGSSKRRLFEEYYHDGFEVEWVDDPDNHQGLKRAYSENQKRRAEYENLRDRAPLD